MIKTERQGVSYVLAAAAADTDQRLHDIVRDALRA
jgi:hypothetical protein